MTNVFSVEIFFITFRESLEASVIISVLLAFIKQGLGGPNNDPKLYRKLIWQVWIGAFLGLFICLAIGGGFIGAFYSLGKDIWSSSEDLWEGIFSLIATIMITFMGLAMLRVNKMKEKWRLKIAQAILSSEEGSKFKIKRWFQKYALALLPFVTTLREGVEAIVFIGGVSLGTPATAFPLAVICGLICGCGIGYIIYRGGNIMSIQYFLIASTCFLYLIAAGLFSKAVWYLQFHHFSSIVGGDVAEAGDGPGSYNIKQSVWHVNCCNPETSGGWEIFNALFGWQNSATYGSVISYNVYWIFIIVVVLALLYQEKRGSLPIISRFSKKKVDHTERDDIIQRAEQLASKKYTEKAPVSATPTDSV
ncbi:high-affinity iron permease FTR1 [Sugiyamaella lignohabitans]|uniref:High-affinity iron permease FTR1 n=1 Tax=Sugiyamaella lignohabitans TaxID=796027 RepID=A0A167D2V7_9ASCO|nr:high-affinity iron permease FTR1 [Sugiyamaella lignohabitans]ANB12411.1 high-affinity iron permease FTR1 [Sugiyamaella lignohabitans]